MRTLRAAAQAIAAVALAVQFADVLSAWSTLPARIASHFNGAGLPDGYGDRSTILLVPIIGGALYLLLTVISYFPNTFNYPVKVTDENRPRLAAISVVMLACLNAELCCSFAYITWATIRVAQGRAAGLGLAFLPILLAAIAITIVAGILRMRRAAV